jgi:hypothetical protein
MIRLTQLFGTVLLGFSIIDNHSEQKDLLPSQVLSYSQENRLSIRVMKIPLFFKFLPLL